LQLEVGSTQPAVGAPSLRSALRSPLRSAANLQTFTSTEAWSAAYAPTHRGSILTIGNFDGIHLGHQAILHSAVQRAMASGAVSTALTFDPSPRKVLRPESAPAQLSTRTQRIQWFAAAGLESVIFLPFTLELSKLRPEELVERILIRD